MALKEMIRSGLTLNRAPTPIFVAPRKMRMTNEGHNQSAHMIEDLSERSVMVATKASPNPLP